MSQPLKVPMVEAAAADAALAAGPQHDGTLLDAAPALIWAIDAGQHPAFFNQRWLEFTGQTREQALAQSWTARVHPDELEQCRTSFAAAFDRREPFELECRLRRADGAYRWVLARGVPRFAADGAFAGYAGCCFDLTDGKALEAALRNLHAALEASVEHRTAAVQAACDELQRQMAQRKRLEQELLEVTEQERIRIGQDLHDNLGQQLTGIALLTRSLEETLKEKRVPQARDARKIEALVNQAISHTRELARHLTSVGLVRNDLPAALKGLASQVKTTFKLSCRFQCRGALPLPLQEAEARQLYNIAQEAVTNAIKHGRATRLQLRLLSRPDKVDLVIRNDGLPFAPQPHQPGPGMGLRIMHYRASVIGAWLEIRPNRNGGTTIACSLPIKQKLLPGIGGRRSAG